MRQYLDRRFAMALVTRLACPSVNRGSILRWTYWHRACLQEEQEMSGFLEGTWVVQCPNGHNNIVSGITRNHTCENDDCGVKSVSDGGAIVVCRSGHTSGVGNITRHHKCPICEEECRRD
jgi:hypothetical protein